MMTPDDDAFDILSRVPFIDLVIPPWLHPAEEPMTDHQAGLELDALIAEKVMGYERWEEDLWVATSDGFADELPHFSTDIAAAWEVVEKMRVQGVHLGVAPWGKDEWEAFEKMDHLNEARQWVSSRGDDCVHVFGVDTAPLAICRAALAAVEKS